MGIISTINSVIPFADPSRPFWKDIVYSLILCTLLWLGPHFQTRLFPPTQSQNPTLYPLPDDPTHQDPPQDPLHSDSDSDSDSDPSELSDHLEEDAALLDDDDFQRFLEQQPGPVAVPLRPADDPLPAPQPQVREQLQPGPARRRDPARAVGAKKARSLARREQIRAHHEFLRERSEMQRARDASTREEREAAQAAERRRRTEAEARIRERERARREARREGERLAAEGEARAVERVVGYVREGLAAGVVVELEEVAGRVGRDAEWLVGVLEGEGELGVRVEGGRKVLVMATRTHVLRIGEEQMREFYGRIAEPPGGVEDWKVDGTELGRVLSSILLVQ